MGQQGMDDSKTVCKFLAKHLDINERQVLPFSTGLIMSKLPVEKIIKAIPNAINDLNENNWFEAAESIMTTDTAPKVYSKIINLKDRNVTITGICKGSGMIYPNMATMLAFIAVDINIPNDLLNELISEVCEKSFNCISVDGDTSTNDSFILMSIPTDKGFMLKKNSDDYQKIKSAIFDAASFLAQSIIRDGEGATKFLTISVTKSLSHKEAKMIGMAIANSPLVKTAFFASDANLGRVLSAIGNSQVNDLDLNKIDIYINENKEIINFIIIDNGLGFEIFKNNIKDILNPYFTTKKKGTGLGLSIVNKIINDHNGKINFVSVESGAKIEIVFIK